MDVNGKKNGYSFFPACLSSLADPPSRCTAYRDDTASTTAMTTHSDPAIFTEHTTLMKNEIKDYNTFFSLPFLEAPHLRNKTVVAITMSTINPPCVSALLSLDVISNNLIHFLSGGETKLAGGI